MHVFLSTYASAGDVEPIGRLAIKLGTEETNAPVATGATPAGVCR